MTCLTHLTGRRREGVAFIMLILLWASFNVPCLWAPLHEAYNIASRLHVLSNFLMRELISSFALFIVGNDKLRNTLIRFWRPIMFSVHVHRSMRLTIYLSRFSVQLPIARVDRLFHSFISDIGTFRDS